MIDRWSLKISIFLNHLFKTKPKKPHSLWEKLFFIVGSWFVEFSCLNTDPGYRKKTSDLNPGNQRKHLWSGSRGPKTLLIRIQGTENTFDPDPGDRKHLWSGSRDRNHLWSGSRGPKTSSIRIQEPENTFNQDQ